MRGGARCGSSMHARVSMGAPGSSARPGILPREHCVYPFLFGTDAGSYWRYRGDSWRARATHMAELQAGLAARALRIDFGGLDRWDYDERRRNMIEADAGYAAVLS